MSRDTISLGVQAGDSDADDAMRGFYMPLRKLLATQCKGPYSTSIDNFAFVLRIDGALWYWNFEGCDNLRLSRRNRYVTIDIGITKIRWQANDLIAEYLVECIEDGLRLMVDKLRHSHIDVDSKKLFSDLIVVKQHFLQSTGGELKGSGID